MGGMGSGRRWHWGAKSTTGEFLRLDIRRWAREGYLVPGRAFTWQWTYQDARTASIRASIQIEGVRLTYQSSAAGGEAEPMDYTVRVLSQQCNYGGHRKWFACPARGCGRRVAILYGGRVFACRECHQLAYPSQREERFQRALTRADRIRSRLGWSADDYRGLKPKGMHWATFERLRDELDYWDQLWNSAFSEHYADLLSRKS